MEKDHIPAKQITVDNCSQAEITGVDVATKKQ